MPPDASRVVAVSQQSFVQRYWPNEEPIGKRIPIPGFSDATVVGVVGDIKVRGLERASEPQIYLPTTLAPLERSPSTIPRTWSFGRADRRWTWCRPCARSSDRIDPEQPHLQCHDPEAMCSSSKLHARRTGAHILRPRRGRLAARGPRNLRPARVHGGRSSGQEIGVRLALGAEPGRIARAILWSGMVVVLAGMLPGPGGSVCGGTIRCESVAVRRGACRSCDNGRRGRSVHRHVCLGSARAGAPCSTGESSFE